MAAPRERGTPPPVPPIEPPGDGLPWVRFITALVAVAMLALPIWRRTEAGKPIARHVITAQALRAMPPLPVPALPWREADAASPDTAVLPEPQGASTTQVRPFAGNAPQRHALRATADAHHLHRVAAARRGAGARWHALRATHVVTRAQVEREYLAHREQVDALTGEDSGSAWLARVSTQRRLTGAWMADHPARRHHRTAASRARLHYASGCHANSSPRASDGCTWTRA